jgi:hypothetical protein
MTLIALMCAERRRWRWAFALLALGTMLKFYPVVFVPPLLIAQYREQHRSWSGVRSLYRVATHGFEMFVLVCTALLGLSLLLSVEGTIGQFGFFNNRPIQAESVAASILWLAGFVGIQPHYNASFSSLNIVSWLSPGVSLVFTVATIVGLLYVFWLQWRGNVELPAAFLLTMLVILCTGKVFSPQYLLWVFPLVAYTGACHRKWLLTWIAIGGLTTWIFPYIYYEARIFLRVPMLPLFYPVVILRNALLVAFTLNLLYHHAQRRTGIPLPVEMPPVPEPERVLVLAQEEL